MSEKRPARYPRLNALRVFEAAARQLNFRLAAEELGVTQGAVAQQVRGLEAELGVKLFDRLPRGLALTEAGRRYRTPVARALGIIAEATDELRPQQQTVTVSATPSFAARWLVPRLGAFTQANPDLDVQVVATVAMANFQSDGVDIAVRQGKPPFGPGLSAYLLYGLDMFAVCSPALLDGDHPLEEPADLAHHVLLHDTHGWWPKYLEQAGRGEPLEPARSLRFSQESLAIDAAIAGQGIALASEPLVQADIEAGRLCRLFDLTVGDETGFYLIAPRVPRDSELVTRMRDWFLSHKGPARDA